MSENLKSICMRCGTEKEVFGVTCHDCWLQNFRALHKEVNE